jgi:hypothetical protein
MSVVVMPTGGGMVPVSSGMYSGPMNGGMGSPAMAQMPAIPTHSSMMPGHSGHMGNANGHYGGMGEQSTHCAQPPMQLYSWCPRPHAVGLLLA